MDNRKQMETVLVIVLGLVVVYWFKRRDGWLIAAVMTGLISVLVPSAARGIHWAWSHLSILLGETSGKILLTVVYILILLPLSIVARWTGHSDIRKRPGGSSNFTERNHRWDKEDLTRLW